jgi:transposase
VAFAGRLPPYSPDFNPIEQRFAKLKALLRTKASSWWGIATPASTSTEIINTR